ncbi:MAG TPA: diphosphomevalonate decarboxylase [Terrimesophilobacter sp.]|uniref:diphosphomevalonate decarboxylase n=1 Tax=Terrimesophilobacter sp. TaxID=2906435 RepID=UPI002F94F591
MDIPIGGEHAATARAYSNIALAKYWGKRDAALNIPAVGSISITLDALHTDTTVAFDPDLEADELWLDGVRQPPGRAGLVLDLVRERAGIASAARVDSVNDFPTGAGLASSASGFAALVVAACAAAGVDADPRELSILARRGSASAARSLFGGYVELHAGASADGSDAYAEQILAGEDWPLSIVVAITDHGQKAVSSTQGMQATSASSPFYDAWVESAEPELARLRAAIAERDFPALGELAEHSCLKLHALMLTTRPALIYWNAATVSAIHAVRELRAEGTPVYFTIDAGPQLKALCLPKDAAAVAAALASLAGVRETRISALGPGAHLAAAS